MTKEEMQLIWDKALIHSWRKDYLLLAVFHQFHEQTGKKALDCDLLRVPPPGMPFKIAVRVFVAQRLEKISNRLWNQPVERDEALINKLQTSKYTTSGSSTNPDYELKKAREEYHLNKAKIRVDAKRIASRNHKTDWNVVK